MNDVPRKHAIIILQKGDKYLQYYDERWESFLFLNCKVENEKDISKIKETVAEKLNIGEEELNVSYVMNKIHSKFSESAKIMKTYQHYFFIVNFPKLPIDMLEDEFFVSETRFKWFSMEELEQDERIQQVNSDIVTFVKELDYHPKSA